MPAFCTRMSSFPKRLSAALTVASAPDFWLTLTDASTQRCDRLLRDAEKEIATHERRRDKLTDELAAAANDHVLLARLGHELAAAESALAATEERWLELSAELEAS